MPAEAGTDLPLVDCWVLVRLRRDPQVDLPTLATADKIPSAASTARSPTSWSAAFSSRVPQEISLSPMVP